MFKEMGAAADVERPEKKRLAPADIENEAAKPQKKKCPTAKQIASKILAENSNTDPKGLYTAARPIPNGSKTSFHSIYSAATMASLPIPAPIARLKMISIMQLASWVNSNQKLLSKANKEKFK